MVKVTTLPAVVWVFVAHQRFGVPRPELIPPAMTVYVFPRRILQQGPAKTVTRGRLPHQNNTAVR